MNEMLEFTSKGHKIAIINMPYMLKIVKEITSMLKREINGRYKIYKN